MKKLFLSMMLLTLPLLASAYDCQVDGIYYNLNRETNEAEVTYQRTDNGGAKHSDYSGSITIPEKFTYEGVEYTVTVIGMCAFINCNKSQISVTIPNSVTSIGAHAFANSRLTSVTIPNSVTSIGGSAFAYCPLTSINIPNSVTSIGTWAFLDCGRLTSVTIPSSVTYIGIDVFFGCYGLTAIRVESENTKYNSHNNCNAIIESARDSLILGCRNTVIPNSVRSIGDSAFNGCSSLTSVTIPNSVTSIGNDAFRGCTGLTSVTIPNSVTGIGYGAFANCTDLTSVTIGNSVTSIGEHAFYNCTDLTFVVSEMDNPCSINANCFSDDVFNNIPLYVPKGTAEKYKSTKYWNKFLHIVEGNPFEHTLTYLVDGETYSTYSLEEGDEITPEEAPTKDGYTFSGWSEIPETMPASDVTVTGTFTINKYKLLYLVDGKEYKSSEIEFGSTITAEENPTKEGNTFSGWSEIPTTMPANDVTITGTFTINKYKLTYTIDGMEYKSNEVEFGSTITAEENPTKEGYTFSGWSEIPATMPASDVTITGSFSVNKYNLTYKVDGVDYKTTQLEFASSITPEEVPTKEGYTFSGWSAIPETMPANDVTITGSFTANKYKLTYMVDGEEYKASEVDYGTAITAEAVPTKEGYTFSGWSEIPSTMPAEDVTVTGTFTVNKYTITYMVDDVVLMTEEVAYGSTIAPPKSQKDGYDILWSFYPTTMPAYSITINGTYTTGINALTNEEDERQVFTPDGKRVETPKKGMNIIRRRDGTVKKVIVK